MFQFGTEQALGEGKSGRARTFRACSVNDSLSEIAVGMLVHLSQLDVRIDMSTYGSCPDMAALQRSPTVQH
jgi:hypothetical protein